MKKTIILAVAVIVIIAVVYISTRRVHHDEDILDLSGNVEVTEVNLAFKHGGRVEKLFANEGDRVTTGQRVAVMDGTGQRANYEQAMASVGEARARLTELTSGTRRQEIGEGRALLESADSTLVQAKRDYERADALFKKEAIAARSLDDARKAYGVALAQRKKAAETLSLLKEGPRKETILAARERVRQARATVAVYEENLKDTVLESPVDGVILIRPIEEGEVVPAGGVVFVAGKLASPWVKVYVKESSLGLVRLNQPASVTVDSFPGKTFEGRITYISKEAEFTPKNIQTKEERVKLVFGVKVSVKNPDNELKPGMPADVRIRLR
ncbi:MAG: efflux RND transporter periplasmic adaptor subunit [Nitrospirae bacterium]|nr:efflux RND transporter periplasmic adaptor subunit [Nitrospirota bacterium]